MHLRMAWLATYIRKRGDVKTVDMPVWTDENVDDIVMGSGAELYPWYQDGIGQQMLGPGRFGDYSVELGIEDDDVTLATFSRDDFRRVAQEVVAGAHDIDPEIVKDILMDDLDATAVDAIIQIIVLGEVRWS